jgi:hypothetical protein
MSAPHDQCPTCGKPTGYLMEVKVDAPGVLEILRGEAGEAWRVLVTIALCVLVVLVITGAHAMFTHR